MEYKENRNASFYDGKISFRKKENRGADWELRDIDCKLNLLQ